MAYLGVIIAAIVAYAFGAIWYMILSKQWMQAAGVKAAGNGRPEGTGTGANIVALVAVILVAGMMRHAFHMAGIESTGKGLLAGLGIGAFIATPWIATNNAFAGRSARLTLIDGVYATVGCALIGTVLTLF